MKISRRAMIGGGLLAVSAVATGAAVLLRNNPGALSGVGVRFDDTALWGFVGGEKDAFLRDPDTVALLKRSFGLEVDGRIAGSVEQVRDKALLDQKPQFLWPAAEILTEVAKRSVKVQRDAVLLRSPIVIFSWEPVAKGLAATGLATQEGGVWYVDSEKLVKALVAGARWADLGSPALAGRARIVSTDPNKSSSGLHFAGLLANLLAADVATDETIARDRETIKEIFRRMGFKTHSSAKMFETYLSGGMGGAPLVVGYENQLVEWILEDPARWESVRKNAPHQPVTLYPRPTVVSAHAFLSLSGDSNRLLEALQSEKAQSISWTKHGFRGSLGATGAETNPLVAGRMPKELAAILPLPEADALLGLLAELAAQERERHVQDNH